MKARQGPVKARAYRMGRRRVQSDRTRANLVGAARRILMRRDGLATFSLESVASRAGVTRLTVYHQFGSKVRLLEAVYDDLARRGHLAERLEAAFELADPLAGLHAIVGAFVEFWSSERLIIRRLRSMAVLDPSFRGATDRDARRFDALRAAVLRLTRARHRAVSDIDECARILCMLTSFETFDALAGRASDIDRVLVTVHGLVRSVLAHAFDRPSGSGDPTDPEDEWSDGHSRRGNAGNR